jgi:hypothetical protein
MTAQCQAFSLRRDPEDRAFALLLRPEDIGTLGPDECTETDGRVQIYLARGCPPSGSNFDPAYVTVANVLELYHSERAHVWRTLNWSGTT